MRGSSGPDIFAVNARHEVQEIRKRIVRELEGISARLADVGRDVARAKCGGDAGQTEPHLALAAVHLLVNTTVALRRAVEADYRLDAERGA